eukprot:5985222-Pleurochrysis_carterae.AAC.2
MRVAIPVRAQARALAGTSGGPASLARVRALLRACALASEAACAPASARKYERSFSTSAAPSTPSTLRIESILSRFCSSGGSGSSSFWILPSTKKPA